MKRRIGQFLCLAGLLLCLAVILLRSRSRHTVDRWIGTWPGHGVGIQSAKGLLTFHLRLTNTTPITSMIGRKTFDLDSGIDPREGLDGPFGIMNQFSGTPPLTDFGCDLVDASMVIYTNERTEVGSSLRSGLWRSFGGPFVLVNKDRFGRLQFPHWFAALIFAIPLGLWPIGAIIRRHRTRRNPAQHLCTNCGYDLRATPERCPECGQAAKPVRDGPVETSTYR